jgi:hypothetical protein
MIATRNMASGHRSAHLTSFLPPLLTSSSGYRREGLEVIELSPAPDGTTPRGKPGVARQRRATLSHSVIIIHMTDISAERARGHRQSRAASE